MNALNSEPRGEPDRAAQPLPALPRSCRLTLNPLPGALLPAAPAPLPPCAAAPAVGALQRWGWGRGCRRLARRADDQPLASLGLLHPLGCPCLTAILLCVGPPHLLQTMTRRPSGWVGYQQPIRAGFSVERSREPSLASLCTIAAGLLLHREYIPPPNQASNLNACFALQFGIAVFCIAPKATARCPRAVGCRAQYALHPSLQLSFAQRIIASSAPVPVAMVTLRALPCQSHTTGASLQATSRSWPCRELYCRFYDAFESMGEPNIPVDRLVMQARGQPS